MEVEIEKNILGGLTADTDVEVVIHKEKFWLMPERCAFRESTKTLLCADLHWGKAETFQQNGIGVSSFVLDDDLARLGRAIERSGANMVFVLGDLVHSADSVTPEVIAKIEAFRAGYASVQFHLIRGNHDRRLKLPESWHFTESARDLEDGVFIFAHDIPSEIGEKFAWCGHIHPVFHVTGRGDSVRVPCFRLDQSKALLPAFSAFTGGYKVERTNRLTRIFAVAETKVIEV